MIDFLYFVSVKSLHLVNSYIRNIGIVFASCQNKYAFNTARVSRSIVVVLILLQAIFIQSGLPIVAQPPDIADKPKDFVNTSCVVIFLCNFVFGILGWHYGCEYCFQLKFDFTKLMLYTCCWVLVMGFGNCRGQPVLPIADQHKH